MNSTEFLGGSAPTPPPPGTKVRSFKKAITRLSDTPTSIKWYVWGHHKTGKTYIAARLLAEGYRILVLDSDMGGDGLLTVKEYLASVDKSALAKNLLRIPLDYEAAQGFFANPAKYVAENAGGLKLWEDFNPDIVVWEGFGTFQQQDITEYAIGLSGGAKKDTDENAVSTLGYHYVQNITGQFVDDFLRLQNPLTGFTPHKILQAHVDDRPVNAADGSKVAFDKIATTPTVEGGKPWLVGQGAKYPAQGCDYGCRLVKDVVKPIGGKTPPKVEYAYDFTPDKGVGGFMRGNEDRWKAAFPSWPRVPADPVAVFKTMLAI